MKAFNNITHIYFIGIGGIGMSALARFFKLNGKVVAGYDKLETEITQKLQQEGIAVYFSNQSQEIPVSFQDNKKTLVVYTPAVSRENPLFQFFNQKNFLIKKRAEVLGMITSGIPTLAVAGTHGKTTTTAILAHILKQCGVKLTAFLGGISENYQTNFIADGNEVIVVEADEFDRSFLHLTPSIAAITSMDADHLDIYKDEKTLQETFHAFAAKIANENHLFYKAGLQNIDGKTIGVEERADYAVKNIQVKNGRYNFNLETPKKLIENIVFSLPGRHNLFNAATALAMAIKFGLDEDKAGETLASFKGVDRRFTYHLRNENHVLIEDYAHHPTEINSVYQAVAEMHPHQEVLAIFQPHLFSRTKDFMNEFAASLSKFNKVVLLDIYPAREEAIPEVTSEVLLSLISTEDKRLAQKSDLSEIVKKSSAKIIVMMGAGDIGVEVESIKKVLQNEA
ncbi:UDP-N-acetylmuramate--L-alanine ligase [Mesonia aquimarina]|uniref:UDP-N-acetylmuramate--L-alanine ligase n=1 Tax=Mesonia aquimarina TaxID=1504967 RepID=UPI000EF5DF9E|nr:UDP-N-acetylmuramate--L-alanine ligase [Mesonia aquimarina]